MHRKICSMAFVGLVAAALVGSIGVSPASATDPPVVPRVVDIVGVGSDTTQDVVGQVGPTLATSGYAPNYNAGGQNVKLYSFDATGPSPIVTTQGCAPITRPNGSSAGVAALLADQNAGTNCIDFARSSRVKNPATDGNLQFVPFATDGVTWATFPRVVGGAIFNAPKDLTTAQLKSIYECSVTNWNQVGGRSAPIAPFLPQSGSGTRSFWLSAIGVTTVGPCVDQTVQENSGEAIPVASRPNAILPYSIAKYIAQTAGVSEDLRAGAVLRNINGTKPLTAQGKLNTNFTPVNLRQVFNVLKPADAGTNKFKNVFGTGGFICTRDDITRTFGFAPLPAAQCGY